MQAFHNDESIKQKYLARIRAHAAADALIQGTGWDGFKGCAVGCTLESYDHSLYPTELGLPEWLARLEDSIFEGLPKEDAMKWPEQFLSAINTGAELEVVRHKLAILRMDRLITPQTDLLGKGVDDAVNGVLAVLHQVRRCHEAEANHTSCDITFESAAESAWSARSAAESAAWSARSAAESAAWSARSAAESAAWSAESAAESAWSAARSAAWSARSAAESAESAAWSAESAAESARSAAWSAARSAAWSAARSAAWQQEAKDLLALLAVTF